MGQVPNGVQEEGAKRPRNRSHDQLHGLLHGGRRAGAGLWRRETSTPTTSFKASSQREMDNRAPSIISTAFKSSEFSPAGNTGTIISEDPTTAASKAGAFAREVFASAAGGSAEALHSNRAQQCGMDSAVTGAGSPRTLPMANEI